MPKKAKVENLPGETEGDVQSDEPQVETTPRLKRRRSINAKIMVRVIPLIVIPLLLIGAVAVGAIALIQQRTDDAVTTAEEVLTTQVVEDGVNRSAERASRELGDYVNGAILDVNRLSNRREVETVLADGVSRLEEIRADATFPDNESFRQALAGRPPLISSNFVESLAEELTLDGFTPEVTLVSRTGMQLASSVGNVPVTYAAEPWFQSTMQNGWAAESLVIGESFTMQSEGITSMGVTEAFQISQRISFIADDNVVGTIRVRFPIAAVQNLLDEINRDSDQSVSMSLVDKGDVIDPNAWILIGDTSINHDPAVTFTSGALQSEASPFNLELTFPGTSRNEEFLTASRALDRAGNMQGFDWLIQVRQPIEVATAPLAEVREVTVAVGETQSLVSMGLLALIVFSMYVGFKATRRMARRITEPVRIIATQAEEAANEGIPQIVAAAEHSAERLPELPTFDITTGDELSVLADSLNVMQGAAVDLAAGQAKLRRQNVARTFVSLGRRNQNLLNRQLEFIDHLERSETDPDTLEDLFRLDHLATRMRRNAENLLVLAGEQTPRRWAKPIALRDVLQAAASEISDFNRVRVGDIDQATVSGTVATDISHLVAELLENAGSFSPPTTPIDILGQQTPTHYRLAIMDQGIGMDTGSLEQANHRLANPVDFADAPSAYIGLFVVGHLAKHLGIKVRLATSEPVNIGAGEAGPASGTIAFIDIPNPLLSSAEATPIEMPARAQRSTLATEATLPSVAPAVPTTPAPVVEAPAPTYTDAGFPKRGAPATAADAESSPTEDAPVEVTEAGFPKRRAAQTSIADTPKQMALKPPEPIAPAPAVAPVASPAAAPPTPVSNAAPGASTAEETTAAGFPKRRAAQTSIPDAPVQLESPVPAQPAQAEPAAAPAAPRDAAAVSSSLMSFKAAVARGRVASAAEAEASAAAAAQPAAAAPAPTPAQSPAASPAPAATPAAPPPIAQTPAPVQQAPQTSAPPVPQTPPQTPDGALTQIHQMTQTPMPTPTATPAPAVNSELAAPEGTPPENSAQHQANPQPTGSSS